MKSPISNLYFILQPNTSDTSGKASRVALRAYADYLIGLGEERDLVREINAWLAKLEEDGNDG